MCSLTEVRQEMPAGFHYAMVIAASMLLDDPVLRGKVIDSARILLDRGDR